MVRIAAYGAGINSTAMIIGLVRAGVRLDAILFSDTGAEKPETYAFIRRFNKWLHQQGQVKITCIQKTTRKGDSHTLEQHCLSYGQLPSIAYGYKQCSQKFKIAPQEKWMNHYPPARKEWKAGRKVVKYLGFDLGEQRRVRPDTVKYHHEHPLIEWGWDRKGCEKEILAAGLCLPPKSSCFFCPNMKKSEILLLSPDLQQRAIRLEQNAQRTLREIKGLGRNYRWEDLLKADKEQLKLFEDIEMYDAPCSCRD